MVMGRHSYIFIRTECFKKIPYKLNRFLGYYHKSDSGVYAESGFAVETLIKQFGKVKFFKLIEATKLPKKGFMPHLRKYMGLN